MEYLFLLSYCWQTLMQLLLRPGVPGLYVHVCNCDLISCCSSFFLSLRLAVPRPVMSSPNLDAPQAPPTSTRKALIIAAYRYGDPSRKRRVKVPPDTPWADFLALLCSRLEISRGVDIEICDENDIGIVSVDDLVDNEVLVVKEKQRQPLEGVSKAHWGYMGRYGGRDVSQDPYHQAMPAAHTMPISKLPSNGRPRDSAPPSSATPSVIVGMPQLSHFIQCNSFGYYFLAEADNVRLAQSQGKSRRAHCIVKVPYQQGMCWPWVQGQLAAHYGEVTSS